MSLARPYRPRDGHFRRDGRSSYGRTRTTAATANEWSHNHPYNLNFYMSSSSDFSRDLILDRPKYDRVWPDVIPSSKRRKIPDFSQESTGRPYQQPFIYDENALENHGGMWQHVSPLFANSYCSAPLVCDNRSAITAASRPDDTSIYSSTSSKRDRSKFEDDEEVVFMSRDEI